MANVHLVWFRQDLRTIDNKALYHACQNKDATVIGIYINTPEQSKIHHQSAGATLFMLKSVGSLSKSLEQKNIPLLFIESTDFKQSIHDLFAIIKAYNVTALFFNRQYEVNEQNRDKALAQLIAENSLQTQVHVFDDSVLMKPGRVLNQSGEMFKVYTPFRNALLKQLTAQDLNVLTAPAAREPLDLRLWEPLLVQSKTQLTHQINVIQPTLPESLLNSLPEIGEENAIAKLRDFTDTTVDRYGELRDFPGKPGTSQLSAYLVYGVLSPRQCIRRVMLKFPNVLTEPKSGAFIYINELIWREFYKHLIVAFPFLVKHKPMIDWTDNVIWINNQIQFEAWKNGLTGYPIVDAAMRQLNQTGWMHNRLRMIVASFLVKDLLIDWRWGEQYFMTKLIDGDFAANNGGWQWAASTGCDAAPYFRIFNPTTQSEKFDPEGTFIRRYVPELSHLSNKVIHAPYEYSGGFNLKYPKPIVSHSDARKKVLEAYEKAKAIGNNSE